MFLNRHRGFSVFSVYPLPDSSDPGDKRLKAQAYEDTMDNHAPADREAMEKLSLATANIPYSRTELWRWVTFFLAVVRTILGEACPLAERVRAFQELLNVETSFRWHTPAHWAGYFWKYHTAVREYFKRQNGGEGRLCGFNDLLWRMRQGQPIMDPEVPPELVHAWSPPPSPLQDPTSGVKAAKRNSQDTRS